MKFVHANLAVRKGIENNFHKYGGFARLMHACLFVKVHIESSFHHCRGPVKLMQASLCVRKNVEIIFTTVEVLRSLLTPVSVSREIRRAVLTIVEVL